jgi:hypothetical protein
MLRLGQTTAADVCHCFCFNHYYCCCYCCYYYNLFFLFLPSFFSFLFFFFFFCLGRNRTPVQNLSHVTIDLSPPIELRRAPSSHYLFQSFNFFFFFFFFSPLPHNCCSTHRLCLPFITAIVRSDPTQQLGEANARREGRVRPTVRSDGVKGERKGVRRRGNSR